MKGNAVAVAADIEDWGICCGVLGCMIGDASNFVGIEPQTETTVPRVVYAMVTANADYPGVEPWSADDNPRGYFPGGASIEIISAARRRVLTEDVASTNTAEVSRHLLAVGVVKCIPRRPIQLRRLHYGDIGCA